MIVTRSLNLVLLLREVGPELLVLLAYDVAVTLGYVLGGHWVAIPNLPLPLLGSAIALVITLRNNTAYARWWEARSLWGVVGNNSRNFTRGVLAMVDDRAEQDILVRAQIGYVRALRLHLLRRPALAEIAPYLPPDILARATSAASVPTAVQMGIALRLRDAAARGALDPVLHARLDATLPDLANAQGGLDRIKNTPLPRHYSQFPRVFTVVYCLLLPLGLVTDLELLTPVGSTVIGAMFLALDRTGRDLEDPFEGTIHDVPMEAIARGVEIDLLQAIGAGEVPEPVRVKDGVLG